jgi:hypothetical protein
MLRKEKDVNLNKNSFVCSFLLGSWRSNQGWSFSFIRAELMRVRSDMANLDIS